MAPPRSDIWRFFIKLPTCGTGKCKKCSVIVKTGGNTANLWQHLDRHHPELKTTSGPKPPKLQPKSSSDVEKAADHTDAQSSNQKLKNEPVKQINSIVESFSKVASFNENGSSTQKINQALMYMVAVDCMPLRTVEARGFLRFAKTVAPLYKVPSRRKFTKMLDEKFDHLSTIIREKIIQANFYSLTADAWTDSGNAKSYLGMTIHFLEGVEMKGIALSAQPLEESHTKEYLISEMKNICDSWGIDLEKVNVIVTDGGANIVAAAKCMFGAKKHLICVDHTLNRMITVAIEHSPHFQAVLSKIRSIVAFFKKSINAADELRSIQLREGISEGDILKVKKDEPTRWGSTFTMLERFIKLADNIGIVLLRHTKVPMLTGLEMATAKEGRDLLGNISIVITELEAEKYSIAGKAIPLLKIMEQKLKILSPKCDAVKDLKTNIMLQFVKRFNDIDKINTLSVATLLDPRFKTMYLEPLVHERTAKIVTELIIGNEREFADPKPDTPPPVPTGSFWDLHDQLVHESTATSDVGHPEGVTGEMRIFLHQPVVQRSVDPLQAWESLRSEEVDVQAGTTSYSFDCYLPDSLPPSFEGEYGRIQYIITVVLQRSGRVDKTFTIEFTVRRGLDLNAEPSSIRRPARIESSNTFRCWPCRSGPLVVALQVPATGFVAGQRIPVVLEVSNRSGCKIHLIQLKLVMVVAYTSDTPRVKVKTNRQDVTGAELDQVDDPDVVRYEESILVPQTPVTSTDDSCKIIQIVYELEAELEVGALHQVMKLAIPIVIGTVPLDSDRRESTIMEIES